MVGIVRHSNTQSVNPEAGQQLSLVGYGIDTAEWAVLADKEVIQRVSELAQRRIRDGDHRFVRADKRGYVARFIDAGLEILVPSLYGDHMGLNVIARSYWCLCNEPRQYEHIVADQLRRHLSMTCAGFTTRLNRVDLRFDYGNLRPELRADEIVTRAKRRTLECSGERISSVQLGQSAVVVRLYDKVLETRAQGTTMVWQEAWNGFDGEVWRLEYQFRRRFLAEFKVSTMEQFLERAGDILDYMAKWAYFAHVARRKDQPREQAAWWTAAQDLLWSIDWRRNNFQRAEMDTLPDTGRLEALVAGCISSLVAAQQAQQVDALWVYDHDQAKRLVEDLMDAWQPRMRRGFDAKVRRYRVRSLG